MTKGTITSAKKKCGNYGGISLHEVAYKVLEKITRYRLNRQYNIVGEYQRRCRKGRSTTYQILTLKMIQKE